MVTIKQVVNAIKKKFSVDVDLYKGEGYYYFDGECVNGCSSTSVYVYTLNQLTLEQWLDEFSNLIEL